MAPGNAIIRSMKEDNFHVWLHDWHARMATPSELIEAYVQKAVNSTVTSSRRLVIGQVNEVHDITTADGKQIIVRISHKEDPRFEAERWALDAARKAGVPTPHVFLVERAQFDDRSVTFCIEEKLPGVPLETLLTNGSIRPERAIKQLGEVLSQIHSVRVDGLGYLQPNGKGWDIPLSKIMLDLLEQEPELMQAAKQWEVPFGEIEQGLKLLEDHTNLYHWDEPSLTHGDFMPAHILIDDDRISGVIDFQECSGNHPVFDFINWDTHWGDRVPSVELMSSYRNKTLFDDNYGPLFHLALLRHSLWMLMVRVEYDNPHGVDLFKRGIERGLRFFSHSRYASP